MCYIHVNAFLHAGHSFACAILDKALQKHDLSVGTATLRTFARCCVEVQAVIGFCKEMFASEGAA